MTEIDVQSWEEFEKALKDIRRAEVSANRTAEFLFRGLSDSAQQLATTLERAGREGIRVSEYYQIIDRIKPQIETFTGRTWKIAPWPDVEEQLRQHDETPGAVFRNL
jgi:hypothetical protein